MIVVAEHGGIVGRGILIDYAEWASRNSITVQALESTAIKLQDLQTILREQSLTPQQGDLVFIRSGFTQAYNKLDDQGRKALALRSSPDFAGLEATKEVLERVWNIQPAAVAGDAPSFERAPIRGSHANPETNLHEWFLGGWGLPIGEMFDLEALSAHCKSTGRYSFFLSSVPLKVRKETSSLCEYRLLIISSTSRCPVVLQVHPVRLPYSRFFSDFGSLSSSHCYICSKTLVLELRSTLEIQETSLCKHLKKCMFQFSFL